MKKILLRKTANGWIAEMLESNGDGWKPDQYVHDLFGTHCLPTCYTSLADPNTVLRNIAQANLDATVKLA